MTDFDVDGAVSQASEPAPAQLNDCCIPNARHTERLSTLAQAVTDGSLIRLTGSVDGALKYAAQQLAEITRELPTTMVSDDRSTVDAAFAKIAGFAAGVDGATPGGRALQASLEVAKTVYETRGALAEVGAASTSAHLDRVHSLIDKAHALAEGRAGDVSVEQRAALRSSAHALFKQAEAVNPFFAVALSGRPGVSSALNGGKELRPTTSEPKVNDAERQGSRDSGREQRAEYKEERGTVRDSMRGSSPSAGGERRSNERVNASRLSEVAPARSAETNRVVAHRSGVRDEGPQQSFSPVRREVSGRDSSVVADRKVAPGPQTAVRMESASRARAEGARQESDVRPYEVPSTPMGKSAAAAPIAKLASQTQPRALQSAAALKSAAAQTHRDRGNSAASSSRPQARGAQSAVKQGGVAVNVSRHRKSTVLEGGARRKSVSASVSQLKGTRQQKLAGTQTKTATGRQFARGPTALRSAKPLKGMQDIVVRVRHFKQREVSSRGPRVEKAIRIGRGEQARVKIERVTKPSTGGRSLQSQARGASQSLARLQRVVSLLKHLRVLSTKELKAIKPGSYDRPGEMKTALAIRVRAQKLIEKVQGKPLKELAALGTQSRAGRREGSQRGNGLRSVRETLARREVRVQIRTLERRLQNFLQSRSQLYKRLTSELTLADLERLVSIVGGARALRGLKRKLRAGEVGGVQEGDISNTFLSQLEAAASRGGSGADSGGGSEDGGAESEVSTGPGDGVESESVLVADGATPTATLTTAMVKEEDVPDGGERPDV